MTPLIPLFGGSWLATPPPPHTHIKSRFYGFCVFYQFFNKKTPSKMSNHLGMWGPMECSRHL